MDSKGVQNEVFELRKQIIPEEKVSNLLAYQRNSSRTPQMGEMK